MRSPRKWFVVLFVISLCPLIWCCTSEHVDKEVLTYERYGKNIIYYDFSKIPDNLILDTKIRLPEDLEKFLYYKYNNPAIENPSRFEQEVWEEANKLGYTPDKFRNANFREAIMATVEIVVSRLTPYRVDKETDFVEKYGRHLSDDTYFHLKLGDCDKYRNNTIGVFNIVKKLNPKLQNVYLSIQELGGNFGTSHAWVSVVILQHNYLVLSHIDPTFYDTGGGPFEADDFHICLEHNIFIGYFYRALYGCDNLLYAYQIFEEEFLKTESKKWQEKILAHMNFIVLHISIYKPRVALDKGLWVLEQYEAEGFTKNLDDILYRVYKIYLEVDNKLEAEKYKQRLLKEFPDSYWLRWVKE